MRRGAFLLYATVVCPIRWDQPPLDCGGLLPFALEGVMLKIIKNDKDSKILIMTPLLKTETITHKISKETERSIKRNEIPYTWATYSGSGKHAANVQNGLDEYQNRYPLPPYILILDDDIILGRYFLDRMFACLQKTEDYIGFAYCPFEYWGHINVKFPPMPYDIEKLVNGNYISSNSLYKTKVVLEVGGFVIQEKYHRLSDWAFFLKLFKAGYIGKLCEKTSFVAISKPSDISAQGHEEFNKTKEDIYQDFILPMKEGKK